MRTGTGLVTGAPSQASAGTYTVVKAGIRVRVSCGPVAQRLAGQTKY
jgi:hypothetical protein